MEEAEAMADVAKIVDVGLKFITAALKGLGATEPKNIGWGTGTTGAAVANTGLETPGAEARTAGTSTQQTTTTTDDTYRVVGTITCAGSAKAITEVGLFSAATDGILLTRATFSAINVSVGDSIVFTINNVFDN